MNESSRGSSGSAFVCSLTAAALLTPLGAQSGPKSRPPVSLLRIHEVSNGFGNLLPHRVAIPDAQGLPTPRIVEIRTFDDLRHLRPSNPILPITQWPEQAVLPSNVPGNHFVVARFDQPLDLDSILTDRASAASQASLTGAIRVERVDTLSGARRSLRGRAFVGGRTYGSTDPSDPSRLLLETWVESDGISRLTAVDPRGLGFPGTEDFFEDRIELVDPASFVFIPDADDDLSTHETFPAGVEIQVRLTRKVLSRSGQRLEAEGLASSSVGADVHPPEVLARGGRPVILPGDGQEDVDPRTDLLIQFTEPIQLLSIGGLDGTPPRLSAAVEIRFGPPSSSIAVPFTMRPRSVFDLATLVLDPAYDFPGSGPVVSGCADYAAVEVRVHSGRFLDLQGNLNTRARSSSFRTAQGPGLVNAPVTPDTIYVARAGAHEGISVIDLNGYGASTGSPAYDPAHPILEGNSNYPNNPNVALQGALLIPPLAPGTCTVDGGSAGVFTLTKDSNLGDLLVGAPTLSSVGEMALGHALDAVYNNGLPFGCAAGGGNLCASSGLKRATLIMGGPNSLASGSGSPGVLPIKIVFGGENLVSWAPHPNPPPLVFPPLCLSPLILGQEPTSILSIRPPPAGPGLTNLLVPGSFPLGIPAINLPPQGLLSLEQNSFFEGPGLPQPSPVSCPGYAMGQQVGQFLYVLDRAAGEVVVLNSNRFLVLDRIPVPDPTALAMSPNLDLLAISSEGTDQVFFLDTAPLSASFHQIVRTTAVGDGPRGLAWESGNEDVFVCCPGDGSVHVLSAFTLSTRKVLTEHLSQPIDVVLTPRQLGFGFLRGVYFGYVLNADGTVAVFESGPNGPNGWGFDEIVGTLPFRFHAPKALQPDVTNLDSGFFVLHEQPLAPDGNPTGQAGGALTRIGITGGIRGILPIAPGEEPSIRALEFGVLASLGEGHTGLSGRPIDLAFDDQRNLSALTNFSTQFSAAQPLAINGKSLIRFLSAVGAFRPASAPQFLFLAVPDAGVIDVFDLAVLERVDTNAFHPGVQSIPAPGVTGLMNYFRQ